MIKSIQLSMTFFSLGTLIIQSILQLLRRLRVIRQIHIGIKGRLSQPAILGQCSGLYPVDRPLNHFCSPRIAMSIQRIHQSSRRLGILKLLNRITTTNVTQGIVKIFIRNLQIIFRGKIFERLG